jgi:hypothetical protein
MDLLKLMSDGWNIHSYKPTGCKLHDAGIKDDIDDSCAGQTGRLVNVPNAANVLVEPNAREASVTTFDDLERYEVMQHSVKLSDTTHVNMRFLRIVNKDAVKMPGLWTYNADREDDENLVPKELRYLIPVTNKVLARRPRKEVRETLTPINYIQVGGINRTLDPEKQKFTFHTGREVITVSREDVIAGVKELNKGRFFFTIIYNENCGKEVPYRSDQSKKFKKIVDELGWEILFESPQYSNRVHEYDSNYLSTLIIKA